MGDQLKASRIQRLEGLRNTAFNFGGPIGIAFTRSFELIQTVVRDTTANLENIDFVLDSLINDNAKAAERDAQNLDPTRQLIYGLAESVGVLVQSILEERAAMQLQQQMFMQQPKYDQMKQDEFTVPKEEELEDLSLPSPECITLDDDDDDEPTPSIPTPPAITETTPSAKRQIDAVSGNHIQTAAQPSELTPVLKKVRIEDTTPISDRSKRIVYDEDDSDYSYSSEDEDDLSTAFPCLHCDRTFKSQKARAHHTLTHEGVQCTICHRHMAQDKLRKHMKEQHRHRSGANVSVNKEAPAPSTPVDSGAPPSTPAAAMANYIRGSPSTPTAAAAAAAASFFSCDKCPRAFDTPKGLDRHRRIHDESSKLCDFCRNYVKIEQMEAHIAEKHSGVNRDAPLKRIKCSKCDFVRTSQYQIDNHLRTEHGENLYACGDCEEKFVRKEDQVAHRDLCRGARKEF